MSNILRWWEDDYRPFQRGGNLFNIATSFQSHSKKFNTEQRVFNISFNSVRKTFQEAQDDIRKLFIDLHEKFLDLMGDKDYIRITFLHEDFDRGIGYPFMSKTTFTNANLLDTFENVIQSYKTIEMNNNNSLKAMVCIARLPSGTGFSPSDSTQNFFNKSNNIIVIENDDNLCLIYAVLTAIYFIDKKKISRGIINQLYQKVHSIARKLKIKENSCGINELKKLEIYFKFYQLNIIDSRPNGFHEPLFVGKLKKKHVYIAYTGTHYNVIKSMKVYHKRSYYCHLCKIAYNNLRSHKCKQNCPCCQRDNCEVFTSINDKGETIKSFVKCVHCESVCNNGKCQKIHLNNFCDKLNTCVRCKKLTYKKKTHVCTDQKYCRNCKEAVDLDHQCFILTEDEKNVKIDKIRGYIFYDYETYQNEDLVHEANLVIAERLCIACVNEESCLSQDLCKVYQFENNTDFCLWLFSKDNENFTACAHNFQGFDGIFVMKYIKENMLPTERMPEAIVNGTKIMTLTYKKVRMIDSFLFIPMALEKFPKTFGLTEMKKGFWCHKFNSRENNEYIGSMPDRSYYSPEFFSDSKRQEFDIWYENQKNEIFDFKKELTEYCLSDVKLLKHGVLTFRKNIINITNGAIDPFHRCITIASLCHLVFRTMLMKPKSIGIISPLGINPKRGSSNVSLQWMKFISATEEIHIQHARNGDERKIGQYYVDGYCYETKTIYEFMGCFW